MTSKEWAQRLKTFSDNFCQKWHLPACSKEEHNAPQQGRAFCSSLAGAHADTSPRHASTHKSDEAHCFDARATFCCSLASTRTCSPKEARTQGTFWPRAAAQQTADAVLQDPHLGCAKALDLSTFRAVFVHALRQRACMSEGCQKPKGGQSQNS